MGNSTGILARVRAFASGLLLLFATQAGAAAPAKRIALTFDDVPRQAGAFFTPDERTSELIRTLRKAGVKQAAFFVTPGNLEKPFGRGGERRIEAYVAAGHVIANHSYSHKWLKETDADAYIGDIDRAGKWLAGHAGVRRWYRFPYLDEGGRDAEKRNKVRAALHTRGLANGYVTVDNYDWELDRLASEARRSGIEMNLDALRDLYVETLVQTADFYDGIARRTLGRSPAHVLLLHETDLAAMYVDDLVAALRRGGWSIVTADEAYSDPMASSEPDTWFLGSGRVAALAHVAGAKPINLVHERTDEEALGRLFSERVLRPLK